MDKCSSPALRTERRISEPSARICATPQGKSYRSVEDEGILEWVVERADSRETISIVLLRLTVLAGAVFPLIFLLEVLLRKMTY